MYFNAIAVLWSNSVNLSFQYLRSLGYCPQFFGLDDFQTGRENLELLLTLRGLDAEHVDKEIKSWIEVVGESTLSTASHVLPAWFARANKYWENLFQK